MTEWKEIEGFEGLYEVSNEGQVRSLDRYIETKTGKRFKAGQELCLLDNGKGYKYVNLGRKCKISVHRLVAAAFLYRKDGANEVNHLNGDKGNNHVSNLEWVTSSENQTHSKSNGLSKTGELHVQSKLTNEDVEYIRSVYTPRHPDYGMGGLARKFGIATGTVHGIIHGTKRKYG